MRRNTDVFGISIGRKVPFFKTRKNYPAANSESRGNPRTVTLKVKFANFRIITRSRTGQIPVRTRSELEQLGDALLEPLFPVARGIRLLGISMSSLAAEEAEQPEFSLPV